MSDSERWELDDVMQFNSVDTAGDASPKQHSGFKSRKIAEDRSPRGPSRRQSPYAGTHPRHGIDDGLDEPLLPLRHRRGGLTPEKIYLLQKFLSICM